MLSFKDKILIHEKSIRKKEKKFVRQTEKSRSAKIIRGKIRLKKRQGQGRGHGHRNCYGDGQCPVALIYAILTTL
jgi:hypothetical protein